MKQKILFFSLFLLVFTACKKDPETDYLPIDIEKITQYLADNNIEAQKLESGLFYIIEKPGSADKPNVNSTVTVSYKGRLLTGEVFEEKTFQTFGLQNLIEGWKQGIPLVGSAGKVRLFIPSPLAYKGNWAGTIPPNSPLIFDITLHYFSN